MVEKIRHPAPTEPLAHLHDASFRGWQLWPLDPWPAFRNCFIGTHTHSLVFMWPTKLKIFTTWSLQESLLDSGQAQCCFHSSWVSSCHWHPSFQCPLTGLRPPDCHEATGEPPFYQFCWDIFFLGKCVLRLGVSRSHNAIVFFKWLKPLPPPPKALSGYSGRIISHLWKCLGSSGFPLHHLMCSHVPLEVMSVLISEVIDSRGSSPERLCQLPIVPLNHTQARENMEGREGIWLEWRVGSKDSATVRPGTELSACSQSHPLELPSPHWENKSRNVS